MWHNALTLVVWQLITNLYRRWAGAGAGCGWWCPFATRTGPGEAWSKVISADRRGSLRIASEASGDTERLRVEG